MSETGADRTPDVIDEVLSDHAQIKWYLGQVATQTGPRRSEMFGQLVQYLEMHETAEQAVIHPQVGRLDDDVAEERLEEETEADRMLARLKAIGVDDSGFDALFEEFSEAVLRHARHEEQDEHPKLRAGVGEARLTEMAEEFLAAEEHASVGNGD